jgi:hypothetical protein
MEDLNKAIVPHREALDIRPQGHPDRSLVKSVKILEAARILTVM